MSEIKEFLCVGCGEHINIENFFDIFYIVVRDEKYEYEIRFDKEVFKCYSQNIKFPFPVKLDLENYKILKQTIIQFANERDLRNIAKAKELELKAAEVSGSLKGAKKTKFAHCHFWHYATH